MCLGIATVTSLYTESFPSFSFKTKKRARRAHLFGPWHCYNDASSTGNILLLPLSFQKKLGGHSLCLGIATVTLLLLLIFCSSCASSFFSSTPPCYHHNHHLCVLGLLQCPDSTSNHLLLLVFNKNKALGTPSLYLGIDTVSLLRLLISLLLPLLEQCQLYGVTLGRLLARLIAHIMVFWRSWEYSHNQRVFRRLQLTFKF